MGKAGPDILNLVGQLHEGVVDDDAWTRGLDAACAIIGSPVLMLGAVNEGRLGSLLGHRMPREMVDSVAASFCTPIDNPWVAAVATERLRRPVTTDDLGGQQALEHTRMWKEFYRPFGVREAAGAVLERQPGFAEIVMIGRTFGQPAFQSAELKAFGRVLPHIARAWRVKRQLAEWKTRAGTLKFVLDRLDRAIVVTGPEGEIRFANRAADRLLSRGNGIDATRGRLRAARPRDTDALRLLIDGATRTGVGTGQIAVDAVAIRCSDDSPPLAVVAEPLAPAHSDRLGHEAFPGAVLFIGESEASSRPSVDRLRIVYGLTPAEARMTSLVVEGHDIASAALAAAVSENTVKYHLKTIFGKVGVSRQTQLVRRVLADVGGLAEPEKMVPAAPT